MISNIKIQNFKSLKTLELDCSNLNLFTGMNGMGKSSVIQSLLVLRQSLDKGYLLRNGLTLKGDLVNLGTGKDVLFQEADKEETSFELTFLNGEQTVKNSWIFNYEGSDGTKYADSDVIPFAEDSENPPPDDLQELPLFNSSLKYLNADRWVKNQYERSDFQVRQGRNVGKHGEFTAHFLAHFGTDKEAEVNEALCYPQTDVRTLDHQVSAWMGEISPGCYVRSEKIPGVDAIKLTYEYESESGRSNEVAPTNAGFGMTYALPVIVQLLSARPGDIVIIENPEAHVHAQGQSALGRLIAMTAGIGVQIFIETHSDHILNGVGVAVHQGLLDHQLAKVYYFYKRPKQLATSSHIVTLELSGQLDDLPLKKEHIDGFFDQINKDLDTILFTPIEKKA